MKGELFIHENLTRAGNNAGGYSIICPDTFHQGLQPADEASGGVANPGPGEKNIYGFCSCIPCLGW